MPNTPLVPFHPPEGLPFNLSLATGPVLTWLLLFVFVVWAIYTLIAVYHWLKFSHTAVLATPAILLHFIVSALCFGLAISGVLLL